MFDIGFFELLLLFIIGLLVVGPDRLPSLARQMGTMMSKGRRLMNELRGQVERELHWQDLQKDLQPKTPPELQGLAEEIKILNHQKNSRVEDQQSTPAPGQFESKDQEKR